MAYYGKAISGNPVNNNTGRIVNAGTIAGDTFTGFSLSSIQPETAKYGGEPQLSVSPNSSGIVGSQKAVTAGFFAKMIPGEYVAKKLTTQLAGVENTFLQSGAGDVGTYRGTNAFVRYHRYNITDYSFYTGEATFGGGNGDKVYQSGIDGTLGIYADTAVPQNGVPAELVYFKGTSDSPVTNTYGN